MKNSKKGISLIVLIITIIVIIILATAILVSVISNNPISEANKARYESDRDNMQAVFTNTVGKIMAENQGVVNVTAGQINTVTKDAKEATGEVAYTVDNATVVANASGTIKFDKGTNDATTYYTGKKLPIYAAGETKWYVDSEGVLSLEVAGVKYGSGDVEGGTSTGELDLSTVNLDLSTNTWEDVQKVVKAGKSAEAGWGVGDTKELEINGQTKTATIIGLDHDGENTATFMVMSDIGSHSMNNEETNAGGWESSEMRTWLNNDIYNSMSNKDYIKEVDKLTDNVGYSGNQTKTLDDITTTQDKVFLLSLKEVGLVSDALDSEYITNQDKYEAEGEEYEWFKNNTSDGYWWLRSSGSYVSSNEFFVYHGDNPTLNCTADIIESCESAEVYPAFVIGE